MRIHFVHPGHQKKRIGRSPLSDVLSSRWPWELIICFQNLLKKYFGEVNEAMFQGVEVPCEFIFCIVGIE
jgi:hypothetical protein